MTWSCSYLQCIKFLVVTNSYILSLGAHAEQLEMSKTCILLGELFLAGLVAGFELSHAQAGRKLAFDRLG